MAHQPIHLPRLLVIASFFIVLINPSPPIPKFRLNLAPDLPTQVAAPEVTPSASEAIYSSHNLAGHAVFAECNPGLLTHCHCSAADAAIQSQTDYGEVTANPLSMNTFVNAIGFKKFIEHFPDGGPITLGAYQYSGSFRLTALPQPYFLQAENPQAVHLMIQFWDGRNALYLAKKSTLEGVIYWNLNPWLSDYGSIKIYTYPAVLRDTGVQLTPDLTWHTFSLSVDLVSQQYRSIKIDDQQVDLSSVPLAQVHHPDWNRTVMLSLTTESENAFPQETCPLVYQWSTQYRDLDFRRLP